MLSTLELKNGNSYIKHGELKSINNTLFVTINDYLEIWKLIPKEKSSIKIFGKIVEMPRYIQNYGHDYSFSNVNHKSLPIPTLFKPYIDYVNLLEPNWKYNGILVNWYIDGNNYIGPHSDDEKELIKNAPIYLFSFGTQREFVVNSKKYATHPEKHKFELKNNSLFIMGGECQKYYKHSITKNKHIKTTRVSLTIRAFTPLKI